jgi:hypothetical protein
MKIERRVLVAILPFFSTAFGQEYMISTVAGGAPPATPALGTTVSIYPPAGVAVDAQGNAFFSSNNCIFKLDRSGILTRVAGNSRPGYSGDGGPAVNAQLNEPAGLAIDKEQNLYVVDRSNHRVRRISADGIITTVAGQPGLTPDSVRRDNVPATGAFLGFMRGVAVDRQGSIFLVEDYSEGQRIRKVSPNGMLSTVAGGGNDAPEEGGLAIHARLRSVDGITADHTGSLFISEGNRVRKIDQRGILTTVAGTGAIGLSGDGGPAVQAQL